MALPSQVGFTVTSRRGKLDSGSSRSRRDVRNDCNADLRSGFQVSSFRFYLDT
jgi:hypothetical protein